MYKKILFFFILLFWSVTLAQAAGFEPGAFVRVVDKSGQTMEGTITGYDGNPEISLLDKSGNIFGLHLKNAKRVSEVPGQTVKMKSGSILTVVRFEMTDGQSVSAGPINDVVVKIDMGVKGQRNLWITDASKYQYVEVVDKTSGSASDGFMKVKRVNGEVVSVPVKKSDVHSIIFE